MSDSKCLVAFYSRNGQNYVNGDIVDLPVGNTEVVARVIQAVTGADLLHLETVAPYPTDYHEATVVARRELNQKVRPKLVQSLESLAGYEIIFIGYPNWWGTAPMAVFTFLESLDFTGKTVVPFCTHEGSGLGRSESHIRQACPGATVLGGIALHGGSVHGAERDIRRWIDATGLAFGPIA